MGAHEKFIAAQDEHFADADATHFAWQTRGAGFASREAAFLAEILTGTHRPLLEIGCGEGANLFHVDAAARPGVAVGLDRSAGKLHFGSSAVPAARFVCGDGNSLPFADGSFETVLIRDVLHHVPTPRQTVAEAVRVLRPGGHFVLAEPNGASPLIRLQMALVPAERGARDSSESSLRTLLEGLPIEDLRFAMAAPFPLDRVLLHPTFGFPFLGRSRGTLRILDSLEAVAGRIVGRGRWSYIVARARGVQACAGSSQPGMRP